jgi:hypothetical protein
MVSSQAVRQRILFPGTALIILVVVIARLHLGGWSASHFIVHGEVFHHEPSSSTGVMPVSEGGYDGQFFTRLGFNPFLVEKDAFGISLDKPAYRAQRMFYPFLAWVFSCGDARIVPYALIGINVLSLMALLWLLTRVIRILAPDASPVYAFLAVLLPGFLFGLSRNLSEPLGVALVAAALLSLLHRRVIPAAIAFSLACLTRETFSLTVFASGLWLLLYENPGKALKHRLANMLVVWSAIGPMLAWQGYLYIRLGVIGPMASEGNITVPLGGLVSQLLIWAGSPDGKGIANLVYLSWHGLLAAAVVILVISRRKSGPELSAGQQLLFMNWLLVSLFMTLLSHLVWEDAWAFCRVLSEWSVLSLLLVASVRPRLPIWLAGYSFALTGLSVARIVLRL